MTGLEGGWERGLGASRLQPGDQLWRRSLLISIPFAALAFVLGALFDGPSGQGNAFDAIAYPAMALGILLLEVILLFRRNAVSLTVTALVMGAGLFFVSKLVYLLFVFVPDPMIIKSEFTESFFWIPALYVLSFFVPNVRWARFNSALFFGVMLLISGAYIGRHWGIRASYGVDLALIEMNLANLTLLWVTGAFIGFKDHYSRAEARSETLQHLAYTDLLTGLPNRLALDQLLFHALRAAHTSRSSLCVLFIDLDGFKLINDTLGHACGDQVLREVAERFQACARDQDRLARISGDEFVMVLPETSHDAAASLATQLLKVLRRPMYAGGQSVTLTASVGLALYPRDAADAETLLRHADSAMYQVKHQGKNDVRRYEAALDGEIERRQRLQRDLRDALAHGELSLMYQPLYDLCERRMVKAEALLRWTHPLLGPVSPATFVPLAEASGAITAIGTWVLREACAQVSRWNTHNASSLSVAVNVSPVQLAQPDFVQVVSEALSAAGLAASALELELTEGAVLHNLDAVTCTLRQLQQLGVSIAIDDFGTGYSSLSYLRDLPIDTIKIDRSFVADLGAPRRAPQYALALVEAILGIARTLDVQVIAEGIETQAQCDVLRGLGCALGQGYFFSKPLSAEVFGRLLMTSRAADEPGERAHLLN